MRVHLVRIYGRRTVPITEIGRDSDNGDLATAHKLFAHLYGANSNTPRAEKNSRLRSTRMHLSIPTFGRAIAKIHTYVYYFYVPALFLSRSKNVPVCADLANLCKKIN